MNNKQKFIAQTEQLKRSADFVQSPFRYPGGKFYALKYILPFLINVPHDEYREPFLGGGSVFFAKRKCKINWLNDLETDLMQTYEVMADRDLRHAFIELLSNEIASRERHTEIKQLTPQSKLELAFKTYYLNRTSYSGIINKPAWGYADGKSSPPKNWGNFISNAGEKLEGIILTNQDFEAIIQAKPKGKQVLMYLDPPYFWADQKRAYTKPFLPKDHERLAALLKKTKMLFCLSYDDCEEVRRLYNWAEIYERSWLYNTANCKGSTRFLGKELIITNYKISFQAQSCLFSQQDRRYSAILSP